MGKKIICEVLFWRNRRLQSAALHHIKKDFQQWLDKKNWCFSQTGIKAWRDVVRSLKQSLWFERTIARAQHRIVRSSKSSACLGVQKAHTHRNLTEQIYWWFMLTHTKGIHSYDWSLSELLSYKSVRTCSYKSVRISSLSHYLSEPRSHCW